MAGHAIVSQMLIGGGRSQGPHAVRGFCGKGTDMAQDNSGGIVAMRRSGCYGISTALCNVQSWYD